jgi:hypothetical protein
MDIEREPFDLITGAKSTEEALRPFAPVKISRCCLSETNLPAHPYAVNITTFFLSDDESKILVDALNLIQHESTSFQQCYNKLHTYIYASPMKIFLPLFAPIDPGHPTLLLT